MVIGVLTLELDLAQARSLKDKRAVLNRVKQRVQNKFNVSIAEIDGHELWNYACLGVAAVSNDQRHCNRVLSKIVDHVEQIRDCEIADYATEFLRTD